MHSILEAKIQHFASGVCRGDRPHLSSFITLGDVRTKKFENYFFFLREPLNIINVTIYAYYNAYYNGTI